jgi:LacI family transcriptional regulator
VVSSGGVPKDPNPTVHDIARVAKVSLATVDRVLNSRPGVSEETVQRVVEAVRDLGYVRDLSAANLARRRRYRFLFVLPARSSEFLLAIREAITEAAAAFGVERVSVGVMAPPSDDPHALAQTIATLSTRNVDGVAIFARESSIVRDAVLHLRERGVAVVTLISDLPTSGRLYFVGVNNVAAGRTAALLLGRFLPTAQASVLVVTASMQSRDSAERRLGFDDLMRTDFPHLRVLPTLESHEDEERLREGLQRAVREQREVRGIYAAGGDNALLLGVLRSVSPTPRVVIAHELTEATRHGLQSGEVAAVINQDPGHLVRSALRILRAHLDDRPVVPSQERVLLQVLLRENLP